MPPTPSPAPESAPRGRRWRAIVHGLVGLALLLALLWAGRAGHLRLPDRHNPWVPLDVAAELGWLTGFKLRRAQAEPGLCTAALAQARLRYEPIPDRVTGPGCGFDNAVRLRAGHSLAIGAPVLLSCRSALAFAMWERHILHAAARRHLGAPLAALEHLGSYACRDVNTGDGGAGGRRSRHATADAIDIAGFVTTDRQRISVQRDWSDRADAQALFLRDAHAGACRFFGGALGPDYNAVHADHFHLESGGWGLCR